MGRYLIYVIPDSRLAKPATNVNFDISTFLFLRSFLGRIELVPFSKRNYRLVVLKHQ